MMNDTNTTTGNPSSFSFTVNETCVLTDVPDDMLCEYVSTVTDCMTTSRIPYLELPYCTMSEVSPLAVIILVLWLLFLFANLSLVVDARVVPNIKVSAKALRLSDTLAGVTLLAFGNGAADIFSAVASVTASPDGGLMMVAGLIGGGLFVTTVVAGVIAYKFEPEVNPKFIARDATFYLIGLALVAYMLADNLLQVWETILLLSLYVIYVLIVVLQERYTAKNFAVEAEDEPKDISTADSEHAPLIKRTPAATFITHPSAHYDPSLSFLQRDELKDAPGTWRRTLLQFDVLATEGSPWKSKSLFIKIVTIVQLPVNVIVIACCPVVHQEDRGKAWDRNLYTFICFISVPLVMMIIEEDAFYWEELNGVVMPWILFAFGIGLCLAMTVWYSSDPYHPPRYIAGFAGWGFMVALVFIYCISDEIVSILRSFGIMLGIPTSVVGMTVLGIGNGICDLIANYLCAANGLETVAITAVYAGPALNLFVGLSIAGLIGTSKWGGDYKIATDLQMQVGMVFIGLGLFTGIGFSLFGVFTKRHGKSFFLFYGLFVIATVIVVVLMSNGLA